MPQTKSLLLLPFALPLLLLTLTQIVASEWALSVFVLLLFFPSDGKFEVSRDSESFADSTLPRLADSTLLPRGSTISPRFPPHFTGRLAAASAMPHCYSRAQLRTGQALASHA